MKSKTATVWVAVLLPKNLSPRIVGKVIFLKQKIVLHIFQRKVLINAEGAPPVKQYSERLQPYLFFNQPCFFLSLSNQDVEVEKQCHFAIVNMKTATTAAVRIVFLLQALDLL